MEKNADFTNVRHFPGSVGNPFDIFLHKIVELEKIPGIVFAAGLFLLAVAVTGAVIPVSLVMWGFFLLDWLLLAMLPRAGRSYGPAKPVAIMLALARSLFLLLPPLAGLIIQAVGTLLVIYGFWIEPQRLTVTRQRLETARLPRGTKLRVLHLGDLHIERITARERRLNALIEELQPDLILFSGDFLNLSYLRDPRAWQDCRAVLSQWKAPLGVYAVTGSPAVDLEDVTPDLLKDMPLRWLRDERVTIPVGESAVDVVGLACTHKPFVDAPRLQALSGQNWDAELSPTNTGLIPNGGSITYTVLVTVPMGVNAGSWDTAVIHATSEGAATFVVLRVEGGNWEREGPARIGPGLPIELPERRRYAHAGRRFADKSGVPLCDQLARLNCFRRGARHLGRGQASGEAQGQEH